MKRPLPSPVVVLSLLAALACAPEAVGHPGHEPAGDAPSSRTWTLSESGAHLHGTFVAVVADRVQVRRDDGQLVTLRLPDLSAADRQWVAERQATIRRVNRDPQTLAVVGPDDGGERPPAAGPSAPESREAGAAPMPADAPDIHRHFLPFAKRLELRWDADAYYVGSNGIPDHPLMVGIRSWQQQVPLPQSYFGDNAWRIPLHPRPAAVPATTKNRFLRGAIALAVNGVPIFNPLNNRGDDAFLFGELDEYGGHCGRADDYHYHLPPVHLEQIVGRGAPIAYALDGYPIYGFDEPNGELAAGLDALGGHLDAEGHYHYHSSKQYPYLNGGFYGEVVERDDQVDPQPRAQPVREYLPPLPGAKITKFVELPGGGHELTYEVDGRPGYVRYRILDGGSVQFTFVDPAGHSSEATYAPGRRPPQGGADGGRRPPPPPPRPAGPRPGGGRRGPEGRPEGPPPAPGAAAPARKPWIAEHFAELDADGDGRLTRTEMLAEAARTFAAYDTDGDGRLPASEYDRSGVRTALAGFVRGHAAEVDADGDGILRRQEVVEFAGSLFDKADRDRDGTATAAEAAQEGPGPRP